MSVPVVALYPDMCWLRRAMLMALLTHPIVKDAEIYIPTRPGQRPVKVPIARGRLFGGPELIEPGLTLAVYPCHSTFDVIKGGVTDDTNYRSVFYDRVKSGYTTLGGAGGDMERGYHAQVRLVVQLFYREPTYNQPFEMQAEYVNPDEIYERNYYGYYFQFTDPRSLDQPSLYETIPNKGINTSRFDVQILPAEELLTQWLDLIKFAIRDLKVLRPYACVRNPHILLTDYPTSTWSSQDANLVFHTAYHVVQFDLSEPPIPPARTFPDVQSINLADNQ